VRRKGDLLRQFYFINMEEIWKDVVGYEGLYQVSNLGRIKSLQKIRLMPISNHKIIFAEKIISFYLGKNKDFYPSFRICNHGKIKTVNVHRLVAEAFIPNPENKKEVNHKNGIKTDNRLENLEWCNHSENQLHALKIGLSLCIGETHYKTILSEEQVKKIKYGHKNIKAREISKIYGIHFSTVSAIRRGKTWKNI
jgi:hypothetical protein